jgi:hypothetical protein
LLVGRNRTRNHKKFNFQPLSFSFETLGKKLAEPKIIARVNVKKIKAKNYIKGFYIACNVAATVFYQNLSITAKVGGFLATAEALLKCHELIYLLNVLPE